MNSGKHSKSSLFLMEIVLSILFFALASAVCMQLFAKAHLISIDNSNKSTAVSYARSAAECFKSTDDLAELQSILGGEQWEDRLTVRYDNQWKVSQSTNSPYRMTVQVTQEGTLSSAEISVSPKDGDPIYSLTVKKAILP